jgi:PASTA domain/Divergent InlB B-repeat domain/Rax2 C-terminal beta propeller domain
VSVHLPARRWFGILVTAMCLGVVAVMPGAGFASVGTSAVPNIPYIQVNGTGDNYARSSTVIGSTVYVGGTFSKAFEPVSGTTYTRHGLYAYDENSGHVTSFAPTFNGPVYSLAHSSNGRYLYAAGDFSSVSGAARKGLAQFDLTTGALTSFNARLDGQARTVDYLGSHLIVGGAFTHAGGVKSVALASLDPTTGAAQPYVNAGLSGTVASVAGATAVLHSAVNSTGTQMAIAGNFTSAGGATHWRVFLLDLGATSATVSKWNAPILQQPCDSAGMPNYVFSLSYAADGTWFAMATTGYKNSSQPLTATVCDAVSRFSTSVVSGGIPTWVNYTGCDSLYSVLVEPDAVYVGGHQRWLNNTNACDAAGAGAVSRPGIGAVDPTTGLALPWNPTRSRGRGADFLESTDLGLTVLSDCAAPGISGDPSSDANYLATTFHPCVGVLPSMGQLLSVTRAGTGIGTVTSDPPGISCGSMCSHSVPDGTRVALFAKAAKGSTFSGWSGACTGTRVCTVTMDQPRSVVATFTLHFPTLTVAKTGKGSGKVTSLPAGINCGSTCSHSYSYGTSVKLAAKPAMGSAFAGWSGACKGKAACTVSMTAARPVQAAFRFKACVVPRVTGKTLKAARRTIRDHGCHVGHVRHAFSTKVKRGHVISQKPKPHARRKHGAKVNLIVSRGKKR